MLTFGILITVYLGVILFGSILMGILCASWACVCIPFSNLGEVFFRYIFEEVFNSSLFSFSFWEPYDLGVGRSEVFQRLLSLSMLFIFFLHVYTYVVLVFEYSFLGFPTTLTPPCPPLPPYALNPTPPLALSIGTLYMFFYDPFPSFPHYVPPPSPPVTVSLFFVSVTPNVIVFKAKHEDWAPQ